MSQYCATSISKFYDITLAGAARLVQHRRIVAAAGEGRSRTGLLRNAVYLVRPDGYVALADPAGSAIAITSYLDARELAPMR